jgi:YD repeat-containing protein
VSGRGARLGNLLRIRQIQERAARAEVLRASAEADQAERIAEIRQRTYDGEERLITVDPETWHDLRFSRDAQAASVRAAYQSARAKRTVEVGSREVWTGTNQRSHVMEKLVDTVVAREEAEEARAEQRSVDDRSGARWLAQDKAHQVSLDDALILGDDTTPGPDVTS